MTVGEILVLLVLVVIVGFTIRYLVREHKRGGGCSGDCAHCGGGCGSHHKK